MSVTFRGAAHIGPHPMFGYRATWPLASMVIPRDYLEVSLWPFRYHFERSSLVALTPRRILWTTSLGVVHRNPQYERFVLFIPRLGMPQLENALSEYGYRRENASTVAEPSDVTFSRGLTSAAWVAFVAALVAAVAAVAVSLYAVSR